jgi:XTP/dITP diphosphohydrolase
MITRHPSGREGFGYDPVFYLPEKGFTMAEISPGEKNRISHRARALDLALTRLQTMIHG